MDLIQVTCEQTKGKVFIFPTSKQAVEYFWQKAKELVAQEQNIGIDNVKDSIDVKIKFAELVSANCRANHDEDHQEWINKKNEYRKELDTLHPILKEIFGAFTYYSKTENSINTQLAKQLLSKYSDLCKQENGR